MSHKIIESHLHYQDDRHDEETQRFRLHLLEVTQRYRLELFEARSERDLLLAERRAANVMAIMLDSQMRQIIFIICRIDRLRSLLSLIHI